MAPDDSSPLALDPEPMRRLGYRTVDMLVDRLTGAAGPGRPLGDARRAAASGSRSAPPEEPAAFEEILDDLERDVLPFVARISHPGYLAFIPGEGTWPGALGDLIASALNVDTCWWLGASGPERAGAGRARLVPAVGRLPARALPACSSRADRPRT